MKAREIVENGIYLNHDAVSERTVTSIHGEGKDKEVYYLDHSNWKHGLTTVSKMAEWATERVDVVKRKIKGAW